MTKNTVEQLLQGIMDRLDSLEARVDQAAPRRTVRVRKDEGDPTTRPDYIEHGSPEHAAYLGLLTWPSKEEAEEQGFTVLMRAHKKGHWYSGKLFSVADEITPFERSPDPEKSCRNVLRQKLSSLQSGKPEPPEGAPARFLEGMEDLIDIALVTR